MSLGRFGLVSVFLSSIALSSCVTDSSTVYISGAVRVDTGGCSLDANGDTATSTTVDVHRATYGTGVSVGMVVNNLVRQRTFNIATDVSTVQINEVEVQLVDVSGAPVAGATPNPFVMQISAGVVPGSTDGISPGQGIVVVPVIPPTILSAIAPSITAPTVVFANITLRGRTNGGLDVEGGPFGWMITLLPDGTLGVDCAALGGVPCCFAGQDTEQYCTDATNAGLCLPAQ